MLDGPCGTHWFSVASEGPAGERWAAQEYSFGRGLLPACPLTGLTQVASWTVAGPQVQLFNEGGNLIATLILSGNRFIGTLAGGTGISMVG